MMFPCIFAIITILLVCQPSLAQTYITGCSNCISFEIITTGITNWRDGITVCAARTHAGTPGHACVIRSATVGTQVGAGAGANTRIWAGMTDYVSGNLPAVVSALGYPPSTSDNLWTLVNAEKETEYFWSGLQAGSGGAVPSGDARYAYANWPSNQPDNAGSTEHVGEFNNAQPVVFNDFHENSPGSVTVSCCMYHHKMSGEHISSTDGTLLFEVEVFSTHISQSLADKHCRTRVRYDKTSGRHVTGQLAVLRSEKQSALLRDTIWDRSDVSWHGGSSVAGFGVWTAGTRTHVSDETAQWTYGHNSNVTDFIKAGACLGNAFCNFTSGETWSAQPAGIIMVAQNRWDARWWAQVSSRALPYACSWDYAISSALNATGSSSNVVALSDDLSTSAAATLNEVVRYMVFGQHLLLEDAQRVCGDVTQTNSIGDSIKGELAVVLSEEENDALAALALAAEIDSRGTDENSTGVWMGATAAANSLDLSWAGSDYSESTNVVAGGACNTTAAVGAVFCNYTDWDLAEGDWRSATPLAKLRGTVLAVRSKPVKWAIQPLDVVLPFACSWHFPYRVNVTTWLTAELQPRRSMSYTSAEAYCAGRQLGMGMQSAGSLQRVKKGGWGAIRRFVDSHPSVQRPVWFGGRNSNGSATCMAYRPARAARGEPTGELVWLDCRTELPTVCYFIHGPATSSATSSATATSTITSTGTATRSDTGSASRSRSASHSPTLTRSATGSASRSRSVPLSPTPSDPLTASRTFSRTRSASRTLTATFSPSRSRSDNTPTHSRSYNTTTRALSGSVSGSLSLLRSISGGSHSSSQTGTASLSRGGGGGGGGGHGTQTHSDSGPAPSQTLGQTQSLDVSNFTAPQSESLSASITKEIVVVKPVVAQAVKNVQTAVLVFALASGTGVAVVAQARLNSAGTLAKCGSGEDLEKEHGFIESPMGLQIGDSYLKGWRGALLGNFFAVCICVMGNWVIGGVIGAIFIGWNKKHKVPGGKEEVVDPNEPQLDGTDRPYYGWQRGALRMRFPTLSFIILMILQPATATAAAVLFFHPVNGRDVIAGLTGGTAYLMVSVAVSYEAGRRVNLGQCTLVPFTKEQRKEQRRKWKKRGVPAWLYDCFGWIGFYVGEWKDTKVYEWETKMEAEMKPIKEKRDAIAEYRRLEKEEEERLNSTVNDNIKRNRSQSGAAGAAGASSSSGAGAGAGGKKGKRKKNKGLEGVKKPKALTAEEKSSWLAWKQWQFDTKNENERYPFLGQFGEIFDDVSRPMFFCLDFVVSSLQGLAAGAGAGPTSVTVCWVALIGTITVCLLQWLYLFQRVGLSRLFQIYLWFSALVILSAFVLAFVKFLERENFDFDSAAAQLSVVQGIAGMLLSIVTLGEIADFVHSFFDSLCCSKNDDDDDDLDAFVNEEEEEERERKAKEERAAAKKAAKEEEARRLAEQREQEERENQFDFLAAARMANRGSGQNDGDGAEVGVDGETWAQRQARQRRQTMNMIRHFAAVDPNPISGMGARRKSGGGDAPPSSSSSSAPKAAAAQSASSKPSAPLLNDADIDEL